MKRPSPDSCCSSSFGSSTIDQIPIVPTKQPLSHINNPSSSRTSIYRGVTRHRWSGRFEAHLWDNTIPNKKGRQVYLGAYDSEEAAAHTYDLAALKYKGSQTTLNFPVETYEKEVEEMMKVSREEYLGLLRRRSNGFSRGVSKYRGVARHHHNGRWEARIGRLFGNKYLYLGIFDTQEEAAAAYDRAAIEHRGPNAVTNFDITNYIKPSKTKGSLRVQLNQTLDEQKCRTSNPEDEEAEQEDVMRSCNVEELSWSFCGDEEGGLAPLSDVHLERLPDPFEDSGFEDDIDFILNAKEDCDGSGEGMLNLVSCTS